VERAKDSNAIIWRELEILQRRADSAPEIRDLKKELRDVREQLRTAQARAAAPETVAELLTVREQLRAAERKADDTTTRRTGSRRKLSELRSELRTEALKRLPSDDAYRLWMTTSNPKLESRWPVDVCVNDAGLRQCIAALGKRAGTDSRFRLFAAGATRRDSRNRSERS
jgi:hypothetical protein